MLLLLNTKNCSYVDIIDILLSSTVKAAFSGGLTSLIYTGTFALPSLSSTKVITDTTAAFVAFSIKGYANNCLDMKYVGAFVGGGIKYKIMGISSFVGGISSLGGEICKSYKIDPKTCVLILQPIESMTMSLINHPIDEFALDLFKGIAFSAIVIATTEFALIFAAELDNSNMCLLGETNFTNMNED